MTRVVALSRPSLEALLRGSVVRAGRGSLYLSHRNLQVLLSKLDRVAAGGASSCTIVKHRQPSPCFQQTDAAVVVTAREDGDVVSGLTVVGVPDEPYYGGQGRSAGVMHPADEPRLSRPSTGVL